MKITPVINISNPHITAKKAVIRPKQEYSKISPVICSAVGATVLLNLDELSAVKIENKLLKNGYKKDEQNNYVKTFTDKEEKALNKKYGKYAQDFKKLFEKSVTKEDIEDFKSFAQIDKKASKQMMDENFEKFFTTFLILKQNDNIKDIQQLGKLGFGIVREYINNSDVEKDALEDIIDYKLDSHYGKGREIQVALKEKFTNKDYNVNPEIQNYINNISGEIDKHILPENLTVYRIEKPTANLTNVMLKNGETVDLSAMMMEASKSGDAEKILKVKEFVLDNELTAVNPRFMSTTLDNKLNDSWGKSLILSKTSFLWKMKTEPNTKGLFVEALNTTGKYGEQQEILLQKSSKMAIKNIDYDAEKKTWIIEANVSN